MYVKKKKKKDKLGKAGREGFQILVRRGYQITVIFWNHWSASPPKS